MAGLRIIFSDHHGGMLLIEAERCHAESPLEAEFKAIKCGLETAIKKGWMKVVIESDCKTAVEALTQAKLPEDWTCWSIIYHIVGFKSCLCNVDFSWVVRQGNRSADFISRLALNGYMTGTFQLYEMPNDLVMLSNQDIE